MDKNIHNHDDNWSYTSDIGDTSNSISRKSTTAILITAALAGIIGLKLFSNRLENVVDGLTYSIWIASLSLVIVSILYYKARNRIKSYSDGSEKRMSYVLASFLGCVFVMILLIDLVDIELSNKPKYITRMKVIKKSKNYRYGTLYLFLQTKDGRERFAATKEIYENMEEGDTLSITLKQGLSGYDHILW